MHSISERKVIWEPSLQQMRESELHAYMQWVKESRGLHFTDYHSLWRWSVEQVEDFWGTMWEYFRIIHEGAYTRVLEKRTMPGATWFAGTRLNYTEHVFRALAEESPAIFFQSETKPLMKLSGEEFKRQTAAVANTLKEYGVQPGDRVAACIPNIPQAVIAFMACASIGAVWSSCSPDFGLPSVIDRFSQIEPKILIMTDGYCHNGRKYDKKAEAVKLQAALPTVEKTVLVPYTDEKWSEAKPPSAVMWDDLLQNAEELRFERFPFEHPLWILYSSGTTGLPKPIVQGQGGILLEHLKSHALQYDVKAGDRFFWYTTTGWMMWNYLVSGLLVGATIVLYDGNPMFPQKNVLWELAEQTGMTFLGTSAGYLASCRKAGLEPGREYDLSDLKGIGSTGSPLTADGYEWVYERVKQDVRLVSSSGGTDVCTAYVGGSPLLPVRVGELQCRTLGSDVHAYDESGSSVIDEVGELVITSPMPSMPLYFWNDPGQERYKESYFDMYPGVWRHGDWIKFHADGSSIIYGRSDSTINRHGVRMGTSEIYQAIEGIEEITDSLIVDLEFLGKQSFLPLFVVLQPDVKLDEDLKAAIRERVRKLVSPRHIPDEIYQVSLIPRTLNGKKLEVPVRRILLGHPLEKAVNMGAVSNPEALPYFIELARERSGKWT